MLHLELVMKKLNHKRRTQYLAALLLMGLFLLAAGSIPAATAQDETSTPHYFV